MPAIELNASLLQDVAMVGESINMVVSVTNTSSTPIEVHNPGVENPFIFNLISPDNGRVLDYFSKTKYWSAVNPQIGPRQPSLMNLEPGNTLEFHVDVGDLVVDPIPPGQYHISASYLLDGESYESPEMKITIIAYQVMAFTGFTTEGENALVTASMSKDNSGSAYMMNRESRSGHPGLGVTRRWVPLGDGIEKPSVSLAINVAEEPVVGWWFAWLEGGRVGAAWNWEARLITTFEARSVGFESAALIERGLRTDRSRASFLVAGSEGGKAKVKLLTFNFVPSAPQQSPETRTFNLGQSLPERILARYIIQGEAKKVQLVWADMADETTKIYLHTLDLDGPEDQGQPVLLLESPETMVAMEMEHQGDSEQGVVDALFGFEGQDKYIAYLTYLRIPLSGGEPEAQWIFGLPEIEPTPEGRKPSARGEVAEVEVEKWAIASLPRMGAPVLAKIGSRLLVIRAEQGDRGWNVVASGVERADHLRMFALYRPDRYGGLVWASWADPSTGIQYQRIY